MHFSTNQIMKVVLIGYSDAVDTSGKVDKFERVDTSDKVDKFDRVDTSGKVDEIR